MKNILYYEIQEEKDILNGKIFEKIVVVTEKNGLQKFDNNEENLKKVKESTKIITKIEEKEDILEVEYKQTEDETIKFGFQNNEKTKKNLEAIHAEQLEKDKQKVVSKKEIEDKEADTVIAKLKKHARNAVIAVLLVLGIALTSKACINEKKKTGFISKKPSTTFVSTEEPTVEPTEEPIVETINEKIEEKEINKKPEAKKTIIKEVENSKDKKYVVPSTATPKTETPKGKTEKEITDYNKKEEERANSLKLGNDNGVADAIEDNKLGKKENYKPEEYPNEVKDEETYKNAYKNAYSKTIETYEDTKSKLLGQLGAYEESPGVIIVPIQPTDTPKVEEEFNGIPVEFDENGNAELGLEGNGRSK